MSQKIYLRWKRESMEYQKSMAQLLGDRKWDEYDFPGHKKILETKLAVLLLGKILEKDYKVSLTEEERILVAIIRQKCETHSGFTNKVRLAFLFVSVYIDDHSHTVVPLIRVMVDEKRHTSNNKFIDHLGRVYSGWDDYRDNHTWKACWLCVPRQGYYDCDEDNIVLWNHFERDHFRNQLENVTRIVSKTCVVAGVGMLFIPPIAPFCRVLAMVGGVAAVGLIVLDISILIDRLNHDQTINITDEQASKLWLDILEHICSVGSFVLGELATWSIVQGITIPITVGIVIGGFKLTGGTIKGINLENSFWNLREKRTVEAVYLVMTDLFIFYHCITRLNGQNIATLAGLTAQLVPILKQNQVKYPSTTLCEDSQEVHQESIRRIGEIKLLDELTVTY